MHKESDGLDLMPGSMAAGGEPVFSEPWEAQAFAMVVALHDRGLFEWREWAELLGSHLAEQADGETYYESWLKALQSMISRLELVNSEEIERRDTEWRAAEQGTPHGEPIDLDRFRINDSA